MATRGPVLAIVLVLFATVAAAGEPALLRLERVPGVERNALLDAGLPLVAEMDACFLALGDPDQIARQAAEVGVRVEVVDRTVKGFNYAIIGLRPGTRAAEVAACGETVWSEDGWLLVKAALLAPEQCTSPGWFFRPLPLGRLGRTVPPPAEYSGEQPFEVKPMVQDMVNALTDQQVLDRWTAIVNVASTRYSTSTGCQTATTSVYNLFQSLGLNPEYQNHTAGHAPNVIGVIPGQVTPDQVYIAIGHIDDMPSSGAAPGADDNASGSAMVTTLAQAMSGYAFASTVKFITVTGEEFGLYGSAYYAEQAAAAGENIQAVLDADMIAWQGDGLPATGENLDVDTNSGSAWLGTLMTQAASDYGTGCPINAFSCPGMVYSDHASFWDHGWSAVCAITDNEGYCNQNGHYPYYHTSNDTIANCGNTAFFVTAVRAHLATLAHLADPLCELPVPVPPTGVHTSPDGDNRIAISWSSAGAGLGYEVYRAPGGCSGPLHYAKVGETTGLSLVDTTASGGITYAYGVGSVKEACRSALSTCVEGSTTGSCIEPPYFVGAAAVTDDHGATCTLSVNWAAAVPYCGASVTYRVYRSTSSGFVPDPSNRIASGLVGTSYDDQSDLVSGTTYYYVVRAVDVANGVEDANTVERSAAPTGPYTLGTWSDDAGDTGTATLVPTSPWSVATSGGHNGPKVYATGDYGDDVCAALTTPTLHLGSGATLSFWSMYDIEPGWDKGVLQISTDGGSTWARVAVNYPGSSSYTSDACGLPTGTYFTGTNTTYAQYSASLSTWADRDVVLRWLISSDVSQTGTGWWVDDISITNVMVPGSCATASLPIFMDGFESGDTSAWSATVP